jgi:hypothetical protein
VVESSVDVVVEDVVAQEIVVVLVVVVVDNVAGKPGDRPGDDLMNQFQNKQTKLDQAKIKVVLDSTTCKRGKKRNRDLAVADKEDDAAAKAVAP